VLGPWAAAALATTGAADDPRFAQVLAVRALDHLNHQRLDEAERDAHQALELMAEPGIPFSANPWSALILTFVISGRAREIEGVDAFVEAARATGDHYALTTALTLVAIQWYVLANRERCLAFAEEAMLIAQRIGNPTLMAYSGMILGGALETTDPSRARSSLETAIEHGRAVTYVVATALAWLARMGDDAANPEWAKQFRSGFDLSYEAGDTRLVLSYLDIYAQALPPPTVPKPPRSSVQQSVSWRLTCPTRTRSTTGATPTSDSSLNSTPNASPSSPPRAQRSGTTRQSPSLAPNSIG
jgi:hypothetical protein